MTEDWHSIIALDALETEDVTQVSYKKLSLAVYNVEGGWTVSDARCTHAGANLCDGYFDGCNIECPLHQGLFDARTGQAKAAPVTKPLKMYECRVHNGELQIKLP